MAKLTIEITGLPRDNGAYSVDLPAYFDLSEERLLKQMADCRSGKWLSEILEEGSLAAILATVCIAMRRAGIVVDPRVFDHVSERNIAAVRFETEDDDVPLATANDVKKSESPKPSANGSSESSEPNPENLPLPGTGDLTSSGSDRET